MTTVRRIQRRPMQRKLGPTALQLLLKIQTGRQPPGFAREVIAESGIRMDWAWGAIEGLLAHKMIRLTEHGHIRVTRAGVARLNRERL